jgi:hypothetical protein
LNCSDVLPGPCVPSIASWEQTEISDTFRSNHFLYLAYGLRQVLPFSGWTRY